MDLKKALGIRIRLFRQARNITQEKLAEMTDLSVTFIGTTERGKNIPSVKTCQIIAEALGVPLWELFKFEELNADKARIEKFASRLYAENSEKVELVMDIADFLLSKK